MSSLATHEPSAANRAVPFPVTPMIDEPPAPSKYLYWKEPFDRVAAALLLIPGLPIIGLLVVITRLTSPGPGIYRQARVGKNGQLYTVYKIRTMRCDAERASGPVWAQQNDPRTTRLGRFLRKVHLDEFPQLFNVLRGEMALVGPRPERPEFTHILAKQIPGYLDRLCMRPGVTGLAQINLQPDTSVECVRRKLKFDLNYVQHANAFLDARILFCTFLRLIGFSGNTSARLLRLDSHRRTRGAASGKKAPAAARDREIESRPPVGSV